MTTETREREYYVQVPSKSGKAEFVKVKGVPINIPGAEDAKLFAHHFIANLEFEGDTIKPIYNDAWSISSSINGLRIASGNTKKEAIADALQKGKPEATVKSLKQYIEKGEPLSPSVTSSPDKEPWEMTKAEYIDHVIERAKSLRTGYIVRGKAQLHSVTQKELEHIKKIGAPEAHEFRIIAALKKGESVPDVVLKDYPELRKEAKKERGVSAVANEVIMYGGVPMRRADVYKDALEQTGSKEAADTFAFGGQTKKVEEKPVALSEFQEMTKKEDITDKVKKWEDINENLKDYGIKWKPEEHPFVTKSASYAITTPDGDTHYFHSFKQFKEKVLVPISKGEDVDLTTAFAEKPGSIVGVQGKTISPELEKQGYKLKTMGKVYKHSQLIKIEHEHHEPPKVHIEAKPPAVLALPSGDLESMESRRSARSEAMDLAHRHAIVVDKGSPKVKTWVKDKGSMDVSGIDTPGSTRFHTPKVRLPKAPKARRQYRSRKEGGIYRTKIGRGTVLSRRPL